MHKVVSNHGESQDRHDREQQTGKNIHEKVGLRIFSRLFGRDTGPLTADNAFNAITRATKPLLKSPVETEELMESFHAPRAYEDSVNPKTGKYDDYYLLQRRDGYPDEPSESRKRGYSLPESSNLIMLEGPFFDLAWNYVPMFTWSLGLRRTDHDPNSGRTRRYWRIYSGPTQSLGLPAEVWDKFNPKTHSRRHMEGVYDGDDVTSYARFHLMFPPDKEPFIGLSTLHNNKLHASDEVADEVRRLFDESTGKWRKHYSQVLKACENPPGDKTLSGAFAYPNRALLLPLIGLKVAQELGVKVFAHKGKNSDMTRNWIYVQSHDLLQKCTADPKVVWWEDHQEAMAYRTLMRQPNA